MTAAAERVYGASDPKYRNADAPPPRAWVDPDSSKGWFRRLMPVLVAHRTLVLASLTGGLLVAAAGAVTPRLVMSAIDVAMDKQAAARPTRQDSRDRMARCATVFPLRRVRRRGGRR